MQGADVALVPDLVAGAGALGGLYSALMAAPTDQVLVIACDMPFLTAPFLARLAALGAGADPTADPTADAVDGAVSDAVVPLDARGPHPLCASYARRVAPRLRARIESGRLRVIDALSDLHVRHMGLDELAPFDPDGTLLLNVNTPADYARACAESRLSNPR
jgi:molybdopterin-guanine dinucleotide biosynthesis protein A